MRALIVAADGTTYEEFVYPFYRLQEAGYTTTVLTLTDTVCEAYPAGKIKPSARGFAELGYVNGAFLDHGVARPDLLVLPGGVKGMEKLRQEHGLIRYIARYYESGGVIASICWAAQLLISAKLVLGRRIAGYYSIADDIENAGGIYVDEPAVVCERIVSSAHYKHLGIWFKAALDEVARLRLN